MRFDLVLLKRLSHYFGFGLIWRGCSLFIFSNNFDNFLKASPMRALAAKIPPISSHTLKASLMKKERQHRI